MDTAKLNDWLQIVGIFAVVASLVFVGLQLEQTQEIALSQMHRDRAGLVVEQVLSTSENPYYLSASAKYSAGKSSEITPIEHQAMLFIGNAAMYSIEDGFYQHKSGFLSAERWEASRATLTWFMSGKAHVQTREIYEENPSAWSVEFQQVADEIISEIDASASVDDAASSAN